MSALSLFLPDTDLGRDLTEAEAGPKPIKDEQGRIVSNEGSAQYKNIEQGAGTSVWCAASDQLLCMGGVYCEDCDISTAESADSLSATDVKFEI